MRVAVVGLGLIGGSIALAARDRLPAEVIGWDPDQTAIQTAARRGAIASGAGSLASAVADADAVFAAAPVGALPELVGEILAHTGSGCVVTDVGSTKHTIVKTIDDPRFVGGHPLAGSEASGIDHARADLFDGSTWYLTPGPGTAADTTLRIGQLIAGIGADVTELEPAEHDRLMAAVSHLPHVFANVLLSHALELGVQGAVGPSFRDATRVAGANPNIWSAIFLDNRDEVQVAIEGAVARLEKFRDHLERGDAAAVLEWCQNAAAERERLRQ